MAKYISLLQLKGGVGKTTITANLAGYLASKGYSVLTVDADMPQGSLTAWAGLFTKKHGYKNYEHATAHSMDEMLSILEQADQEFDYILIDSPPRIAEIMRSLIIVSDLVLLPLNVTAPEIWAIQDTETKVIKAALEERPDLNIRLVLNRIKDRSSTFKLSDQVTKLTGLKFTKQYLTDYDSYQTIVGKGTHAAAYHVKKPKEQFTAFAKEVLSLIQ
ncbi:ParA family protein [Acinetobacter schindleri]|uniref:CobQ/CobB/MinD/ParA nucleotide binding domain-containing protein n=1 Tax=Acinetobacter schindleri NIPH 900 TaxID=1217675 RepID=N8WRR0_9GAMM|nr:ParA family protein [Acinetobacter schindleri]ENV14686.1 hypothetical protein F965_00032 [Acinetobacter schindleri NIPH 900]